MADKLWVGTDTGNEGDWATAANWLPSGVPANGDDVYLENSSQSVTEGFDQSAVAPASLNIAQSFTGTIGDADEYLEIAALIVNIGYNFLGGNPAGSGRIKLDVGAAEAVITVHNTGSSVDANLPPVRIIGSDMTSLEVRKGKVGLAVEVGETATITTIRVGFVTNKTNDSDVYIGEGVTITNLYCTGGDVVLKCAASAVKIDAGVNLITEGSGAITNLYVYGGTATLNATGTIGTLTATGGTSDFTKSGAARTVTAVEMYPDARIKWRTEVTLANDIAPFIVNNMGMLISCQGL